MDFEVDISFVNDTPFTVDVTIDNEPDFEVTIQFGQDTSEELGIQDIIDGNVVKKDGSKLGDTSFPATNLHAPHSDDQDLSGYELISNKKTDIEANKTSDTFYASIKAIYNWCIGLFEKKWIYTTITLTSGGWSLNTQSVTVTGLISDVASHVEVFDPVDRTQREDYYTSDVSPTGISADTLTFTSTTDTTVASIVVPIRWRDV